MSDPDGRETPATGTVRACFVSASGQNVFFEELLEALRAPLEAIGIASETAVDHFPPLEPDLVYVFVPHEYVPLTLPEAHPSDVQLRRSVVVATEQPGTQWFEESARVAARAATTVDLQALGVDELRRRGIRARLLPLGYVPAWDEWGGGTESPRPVDVTFVGGYTPRRALALARCGSLLSEYRTSLRLVEPWRPHTVKDAFFLSGERKFRHFASSKIVLSAHRDANAYFEWPRAIDAITNGCVVLTEHSSAFAPLVPGEHFVSASFEHLPTALAGLLADEDYVASIRQRAYEFVKNEMPLSSSIQILADAIEEAASYPVRAGSPVTAPAPAPKRPPLPPTEWDRLQAEPPDQAAVRATLKRLALGQRRLERQLAHVLADGAEDEIRSEPFGPNGDAPPRISVALTVYNYAETVREAIESVGFAATDAVELLVVDDASTDDSADVIRQTLRERVPWLRATFLQRARNAGLPAARNVAFERARGEFVFVLDADNVIYPHALSRLAEALDADPDAAFAYGILEKFDATGPTDLVSWIPWQPGRFKYGNYIDAMALVRRTAFEQVGGYTTDERLYGWEDFALWCAFAQSGRHGAPVPEIVGRYRASAGSMITVTNIDTRDAWELLLERFPFLRDGADQWA